MDDEKDGELDERERRAADAEARTSGQGGFPAGWYLRPDGKRRYWDGARWSEVPAPDESEAYPTSVGSQPELPAWWSKTPADRSRHGTPRRAPSIPFQRAQPDGGGWPAQRKASFWLIAVMTVVAIITGTSGALIGQHQQHVRQVAAAAAASASAEASRKAAAERQAAIDKAKHDLEVLTRKSGVTQIESSVKQMATQQAATGLLSGPVISVTCTPAAGSSIDDLDQNTTDFGCFAATKDNGDGTLSGYNYHATMNWSSGQFTYGFGKG
jgi:hypothetical protein